MQFGGGRAVRLGKSEIEALACPPGRRDVLVGDDALTGFCVRVTNRGAKIFLLQYSAGGRTRRLGLGRYGEVTPAQARKLAEAARGVVVAGRDPLAERQAVALLARQSLAEKVERAAADGFTFERLLERWERDRLSHRSPRYLFEAGRAVRRHCAELLEVPACNVDAPMLRLAMAEITKGSSRVTGGVVRGPLPTHGPPGQTVQRRVRAYAHAMFAWGMKQGLVGSNPVSNVHVEGRVRPRERVLSDTEIGEVWRASGALGWPWCPYVRVLLLTLQRANEVAGMRWFELAEDRTRWELPGVRVKNREPHIIHLAPAVRSIIAGVPRKTMLPGQTPSPFVFTTTGLRPVSGFSHAKDRLDAMILHERILRAAATGQPAAPLVPWRLHDFRRTGVTVMARSGVSIDVADRILNHVGSVMGVVKATYQRHHFLIERAEALDQWAEYVEKIAEDTAPPAA